MFAPLPRRPSAVTLCAASLRRVLVRGELRAGERLPPERHLAERLGVNRTTLRAALNELARDGLLDPRHGSGHVVRDFRATGGPDLAPAVIEVARETGDLRGVCADLFAVRRALAAALLERMAAATPDRGLAPVARAIDGLEAAAQRGARTDELADADLAVVRAWVDAAGSTVLGLFVQPIARLLAGLPELRAAVYADPLVNVALWRGMLESVRTGTLDRGAVLAALAERDRATLERL